MHQPLQTGVSIAGVAFALLLVFMQLGFMGAVAFTATNVLEQLEFDVLLRVRTTCICTRRDRLSRSELKVAANTSCLFRPAALISVQNWRSFANSLPVARDEDFQSQYLPIAVMAFEPSLPVFRSPQIQTLSQLREDTILLDDSTQADHGPLDDQPLIPFLPWRLGGVCADADVGRETEIGGKAFTITGLSISLGTGLAANGALITSPPALPAWPPSISIRQLRWVCYSSIAPMPPSSCK
ncbi:MAG: hypothetical protein R3C56_03765 [Pirellulaceae bacterium]